MPCQLQQFGHLQSNDMPKPEVQQLAADHAFFGVDPALAGKQVPRHV